MLRRKLSTLVAIFALWPAVAGAQEGSTEAQATTEEPRQAEPIRAVERGFFLETDLGLTFLVNKLKDPQNLERRFGLAPVLGLFMGIDILPILSLSIGGIAIAAPVSDAMETPAPRGDLLFLAPSAQLQFALITTERNFLYLRGGAGFGFALPEKLGDSNNDGEEDLDYGGKGPLFMGAVGFERFTKLRHFSIGIHAGAIVVTKPSVGIAATVTPTLKYTF
jgi:hypothetical protein